MVLACFISKTRKGFAVRHWSRSAAAVSTSMPPARSRSNTASAVRRFAACGSPFAESAKPSTSMRHKKLTGSSMARTCGSRHGVTTPDGSPETVSDAWR